MNDTSFVTVAEALQQPVEEFDRWRLAVVLAQPGTALEHFIQLAVGTEQEVAWAEVSSLLMAYRMCT